MKKLLSLLLVVVMVLGLAACGSSAPASTTAPAAPTAPAADPAPAETADPTAAPVEPVKLNARWR